MLSRLSCRFTESVAALFLVLLSGCARPSETGITTDRWQSADLDHLLDLMRQRLVVMHDVARWKWNSRVPVADPVREQAILDNLVEQSKQHGLDPVFVRDFFVAQFDAAKRIQNDDFRQWQDEQQAAFADIPDLVSQLRPKIDQINRQLLASLATVRPLIDDAEARRKLEERAATILKGNGITPEVRNAAIGLLVAR